MHSSILRTEKNSINIGKNHQLNISPTATKSSGSDWMCCSGNPIRMRQFSISIFRRCTSENYARVTYQGLSGTLNTMVAMKIMAYAVAHGTKMCHGQKMVGWSSNHYHSIQRPRKPLSSGFQSDGVIFQWWHMDYGTIMCHNQIRLITLLNNGCMV